MVQMPDLPSGSVQVDLTASPIPGKENQTADALSRKRLCLSLHPQGSVTHGPTQLSQESSFAPTPNVDILSLEADLLYSSTQKQYLLHKKIPPLPLSKSTLLFAAFLAYQGLKPQSVNSHLATVRHNQVHTRLPVPNCADWPRLHHMLRGITPPPLHVKWYPPLTIPKTTSAPPYNCSCHAKSSVCLVCSHGRGSIQSLPVVGSLLPSSGYAALANLPCSH